MDNESDLEASFDLVARQDAADAVLSGLRSEIAEVKSRLDRVSRVSGRPVLAGSAPRADVLGFVDGFLRHGREQEMKSLTTVAADGSVSVPSEIDDRISATLTLASPIRAIAQVVQVGSAGYRKLVTTSGTASGWVSETSARPETSAPAYTEVSPPMGELYANPSASQTMLDDAAFDLVNWLGDEIANEFARAESAAFVGGNGANQPLGFLASPVSAAVDGNRAFGALQYLPSGDASGLDATPDLTLIDLVHALKSSHRQGAVWVMNSATLAAIRKLKSADGTFLWQPSLIDSQPSRLLGYPVVEAEDMPDIAANACPIAFGNFRNGYLIVERGGTAILRDPYTNKPFVNFYATRRVGGQVLDSEAIKLLKISA